MFDQRVISGYDLTMVLFDYKKNTYEPASLSTNTLRAKSSIEYVIRSSMLEQSGSVASCFSLSVISVKAAMKKSRRSGKEKEPNHALFILKIRLPEDEITHLR